MVNWKRSVISDLSNSFNNKFYIFGILLLTIAAYGFTFSNFSLGIDDFGYHYYMDFSSESYRNMIQQGRLLHVIFHYLGGLVDVVPFLNNFLSSLCMAASGIFLCSLLNVAVGNKMKNYQKLLFIGIYISYPAIAFKYIYDIDVLVTSLSYLCVVLAVIFAVSFSENFKICDGLLAIIFAIFAIGSYETFNTLYVCIVLAVLLLMCINKKFKFKELFISGCIQAALLTISILIYYGSVKLLQFVTNNQPIERTNIFTMQDSKKQIITGIFERLFNPRLFFTTEFLVSAIIFSLIIIFYTIYLKLIS